MKNSLMLIESPNKIASISKYLEGTDIEIMATVGHIRDLDTHSYRGLGFSLKNYDANWVFIKDRKQDKAKLMEIINERAKKCKHIYLSTDPDREGEAISWHIYTSLNEENRKKCLRVSFNEITKTAIENALKNPRELDQNQINSFLARRLLDRGIGFRLSNFVNKNVGGLSAGRVQSIALKFLRDRYDEIQTFIPDHWFNLIVILKNGLELTLKEVNPSIKIEVKDDKSNGLINFVSEEMALAVKESLLHEYTLESINEPRKEKQSAPKAFKTSTLHQSAINKLGMTSAMVERAAQKLYEGVEIDGESIALITYPRTDREDLSETFSEEARKFIEKTFSKEYVKSTTSKSKKKSSSKKKKKEVNVQGAHEGIRPTYVDMTPEKLEGKLENHEFKLYKLIWSYAVASLMADAEFKNTLYVFENNKNRFTTNHRLEVFEGFRIIFKKNFPKNISEDPVFPEDLKIGNKYEEGSCEVKRVDKKPPPLYTEASLINALDSEGVGRPSTFKTMVGIVVEREYAVKNDGKLEITELGIKMSDVLQHYFPTIMRYEYTRNMEMELDNISENKVDWKEFLEGVFKSFFGELKVANQDISKVGRNCSKCGKELVFKISKAKRKFIGCSGYPECDYVEFLEDIEKEMMDEECPECSSKLVRKKNRWDKYFVSCSNYPACKYIKNESSSTAEALDRSCPQCNNQLVKKQNKWGSWFISCKGYPKCKYIENIEEKETLDQECPECHNVLEKVKGRWNKYFIRCSNHPNCKYRKSIKETKNG